MYLQSFENNGSQPEQYYRYDPEIHGGKEILEKPFLLINSTSIPFTIYTSGFSFRIVIQLPDRESRFHKIGVAHMPICNPILMI